MKIKKTVIPILAAAILVVLAMVVRDNSFHIYYASDVEDPNYAEKLTEEERQFNEIINKHINMQSADGLKEYKKFGLVYDAEEDQMYYKEIPVCYFADNLAADGSFEGTEMRSASGNIGIIAERDEDGTLTGLTQLDAEELEDFLSNGWKTKK